MPCDVQSHAPQHPTTCTSTLRPLFPVSCELVRSVGSRRVFGDPRPAMSTGDGCSWRRILTTMPNIKEKKDRHRGHVGSSLDVWLGKVHGCKGDLQGALYH
jgi:hypothetical protein